jgi:hypothetical protein
MDLVRDFESQHARINLEDGGIIALIAAFRNIDVRDHGFAPQLGSQAAVLRPLQYGEPWGTLTHRVQYDHLHPPADVSGNRGAVIIALENFDSSSAGHCAQHLAGQFGSVTKLYFIRIQQPEYFGTGGTCSRRRLVGLLRRGPPEQAEIARLVSVAVYDLVVVPMIAQLGLKVAARREIKQSTA